MVLFGVVGDRRLGGLGLLRLLLGELPLLPLLDDVPAGLHAPAYLEVILVVVAAFLLPHAILTM